MNDVNDAVQKRRGQHARFLGTVYAFSELIRPLKESPSLSEARQIQFIEKIDSPDLPPNEMRIFQGDSFILLRNIDTRYGLAKDRRCRAEEHRNRVIVLALDDGTNLILTKIPMEKAANGMKFMRCQFPLKIVFAGTVHQSQGMTLDRVGIDCRSKFWGHGHRYVALSRARKHENICILLPLGMPKLTIHGPVDSEVVDILDTFKSSKNPFVERAFPVDQMNEPGDETDNVQPRFSHGWVSPGDSDAPPDPDPDPAPNDGPNDPNDPPNDSSDPPNDELDPFPPLPDVCVTSTCPLDDEVDDLQTWEEDAIEIVQPPLNLPVNNDTVIRILEDQSILRFNCLGPRLSETDQMRPSVSMARVLSMGAQSSEQRFQNIMDGTSPFSIPRQMMISMSKTGL
jgi:hypothetical protein